MIDRLGLAGNDDLRYVYHCRRGKYSDLAFANTGLFTTAHALVAAGFTCLAFAVRLVGAFARALVVARLLRFWLFKRYQIALHRNGNFDIDVAGRT